jgi:hypothetical protein
MAEWNKEERGEEKNGVIIIPRHTTDQFTTSVDNQNSNNASGLRALLNSKTLLKGTAELSIIRAIINFLNIRGRLVRKLHGHMT